MEQRTPRDWRLQSRQAIVGMGVEILYAAAGADRLSLVDRAIYLLVLDATLHGTPISAARLSLISGLSRTAVTRRLVAMGPMLSRGRKGWAVSEDQLTRPEARARVERLSAVLRRTYEAVLSETDT
jgi:hypothetical protein